METQKQTMETHTYKNTIEPLRRTIENIRQAFALIPSINDDVTFMSYIKKIEPEDLIKYALENGLDQPEIMHDVLWTSQKFENFAIHLESKPVVQHWSYAGSKIEYPSLIGM